MKRLNGWQRIGIILSVVWPIGGGMLVHQIAYDALDSITDHARSYTKLSESDRVALNAGDLKSVSDDGLTLLYNETNREVYTRTVIWTLVPLIAVWVLVRHCRPGPMVTAGFKKA
jgi:hypothetical protein